MTRNVALALVAVVVIGVTGLVLSQVASSQPDGLEYVSEDQGFADTAQDHTLSDAPLADYGENVGSDAWVGTAVAGLVGIVVTGGLAIGLFWLARSRRHEPSATP